jgi:hypothetical protein
MSRAHSQGIAVLGYARPSMTQDVYLARKAVTRRRQTRWKGPSMCSQRVLWGFGVASILTTYPPQDADLGKLWT